MLEDDLEVVLALERRAAGEHLVDEDAERVDVAPRVGHVPRLLRRHVLGAAEEHAVLGDLGIPGLPVGDQERLHQAEVEDLDHVVVGLVQQHHVRRLEVAVNDAELVRLTQRPADLLGDVENPPPGKGLVVRQHLCQRLPLHVLHGDEVDAVLGLPVVDDGDRVRVAQLRGEAGLEEEAALERRILLRGEVGVEDLQRHHAVQRRLHRLVDLPHPARTERREDAEAVVQDAADQRIGGAHDGWNRALGIALEHAHGLRGGDRKLLDDQTTTRRDSGKRPEEKSAAYICADLALECALEVVELRPKRSVEHHRANLSADAAQDVAVHAGIEHHLLLDDL